MKKHCTLAPDKIIFDVSKCCKKHDIEYQTDMTKFEADKNLFKCMIKKKAIFTAIIYFLGVSIFGHRYYKKAQKQSKLFK